MTDLVQPVVEQSHTSAVSTMVLTLCRLDRTPQATYGQLLTSEKQQLAVTLERPWVDNRPDVSCIPPGQYTARRFRSPHFGYDLFRLTDVPSRDAIELHIGNIVADTDGCILLGTAFGTVEGEHGITSSTTAFQRFMGAMRGVDTFTLLVTDPED